MFVKLISCFKKKKEKKKDKNNFLEIHISVVSVKSQMDILRIFN